MASLALALRRPHLLFRKQSSQGSKELKDDRNTTSQSKPPLVTFEQLPKWYQDNPYIRSGYRPVSNSYNACIYSLSYLHNETVNIYTHLLPAVILAFALPTLQINISRIYRDAPWMDRFMLTLTPMAALATLSLSTTYHTLMNHSPFMSYSCLLADYTGILILILASFITGIYVGFYSSPFHQQVYWGMIVTLIAVSCTLVLHPRLQGPVYRGHRTAAFIATALSGFAPVIHGCYYYGLSEAFWKRGVLWWLAEGFWYGLGAFFFASRWPERKWKGGARGGKVEIFGSSHQIFHTCVVLGAAAHCWGVWSAWRNAQYL
jgi:adiponectin receptor